MLSTEEQKQYHRHLILNGIGEAGQLRLKNASVLVVGAGGLGCPILQYLAAAGVGKIGIVDGDRVDQSNLQRQILFTIDDIGTYKSEAAKKRLERLNPLIRIEVYNAYLTPENALSITDGYDIIVDGSDNFQTRYLVNDACVVAGKPLVFGSIFKFDGQVTVFNYKGGPTYRCLYPTAPALDAVPNCADIGVLGVLPGMIGTLQANEVIKMICGIGEVLSGQLLNFDALTMTQYKIKFKRTEEANLTQVLEEYDTFCGIVRVKGEIDYATYKKQADQYHLVDIRTARERKLRSLGGIHMPLDQLPSSYQQLPQDKPLVFYCQSGQRSSKAVRFMKDRLPEVNSCHLEGGLSAIAPQDER